MIKRNKILICTPRYKRASLPKCNQPASGAIHGEEWSGWMSCSLRVYRLIYFHVKYFLRTLTTSFSFQSRLLFRNIPKHLHLALFELLLHLNYILFCYVFVLIAISSFFGADVGSGSNENVGRNTKFGAVLVIGWEIELFSGTDVLLEGVLEILNENADKSCTDRGSHRWAINLFIRYIFYLKIRLHEATTEQFLQTFDWKEALSRKRIIGN